MSAEPLFEQLASPGIGFKLAGLLLVSVFFLFWPGFNELSDLIGSYLAESKTGKLTRRIYQTITVPHGGAGNVLLDDMSLSGPVIHNERVIKLEPWLKVTEDKGVQVCTPVAKQSNPRAAVLAGGGGEQPRAQVPQRAASSAASSPVPSGTWSTSSSSRTVPGIENLREEEDEEILRMLRAGEIAQHVLEKRLGDARRAVSLRRRLYAERVGPAVESLPFGDFDYDAVVGSCCEVVVGYVGLPLGVVGPLAMDGEQVYVPMATTEGTLVASTNRGAKAITASGGADTEVLADGITRAPCVQLPSMREAAEVKRWVEAPENRQTIAEAFNSTTRFGHLDSVKVVMAGRLLYIRVKCFSGDAMGMNMVSKGTDKMLEVLMAEFPGMEVVSLSGNLCTDKKPSAVNWIEGRGKSVCAEAVIRGDVVRKVLKTTVDKLVDLNNKKNLVGSALAGSIGGNNAHAANIVAAVFLATGQDPAQVVESANCMTLLEPCNGGADLRISVTMPSIEVGTIGGGTVLAAQGSCLDMLGCRGSGERPGENATKLARVVATTVMCAELSLLSALSVGHLVQAHMKYNRSTVNLNQNPDK